MTWNIPKIREVCLELLGWKTCSDSSCTENTRLTGKHRHMPGGWVIGRLEDGPDPTTSLDDALPLMNVVPLELLLGGHAGYFKVIGTYPDGTTTDSEGFSPKDSVPLAICIVVLQCAGRDLKEFEV